MLPLTCVLLKVIFAVLEVDVHKLEANRRKNQELFISNLKLNFKYFKVDIHTRRNVRQNVDCLAQNVNILMNL